MNDRKLKQLFDAARREVPPSPPAGFDQSVRQLIVRGGAVVERATVSLFGQLNGLFPRLGWVAAALIVFCVAGDLLLSSGPALTDEIAQLSDQGILDANDF
jgi:hypothetical protein